MRRTLSDIRDEIRGAFEAEWPGPMDAPGLGDRIALEPPLLKRSRGALLPALAAVATAALFLLAGGAAMLFAGRRGHQPPPPAAAVATPTPVATPNSFVGDVASPVVSAPPEPDYGPPPAGVPVFYYIDPRQPTWLVATDWAGKPRGTIRLSAVGSGKRGFPSASADGSRILVGGRVYDTGGHDLGAVGPESESPSWADDNRHLCGMSPEFSDGVATVPQRLFTVLPGQGRLPVAVVGQAGSQAGGRVAACSFATGTAVAVQAYNDVASEWWLVALQGGRVLHHQVYRGESTSPAASSDLVRLVVSRDARMVAENHAIVNYGTGKPAQAAPTVIRDSRTGRVLGTLPDGAEVISFSADGSQVLVGGPGTPGLAVRNSLTGAVVFSLKPSDLPDPADGTGDFSAVRPDRPGFAVALQRTPALYDVVLIGADLRVVTVATGVQLVPNN